MSENKSFSEEILELKIVLLWIRNMAAGSAYGKCACGAIFGMADAGAFERWFCQDDTALIILKS